MKINLNNLLPEGSSFNFSNQDKELNSEISDLTGGKDFKLKLNLKPLGDAVELTGELKAGAKVNCSFCDEEYTWPVKESFKQYLVPTPPPAQNKSAKTEINEEILVEPDDSEDNVGLEYDQFNPEAFLRDKIGFAIPFQVPCKTNEQECENYAYTEKTLKRHQAPEFEEKKPFSALSDLKIDKKR